LSGHWRRIHGCFGKDFGGDAESTLLNAGIGALFLVLIESNQADGDIKIRNKSGIIIPGATFLLL
jgi:hypothetical protein